MKDFIYVMKIRANKEMRKTKVRYHAVGEGNYALGIEGAEFIFRPEDVIYLRKWNGKIVPTIIVSEGNTHALNPYVTNEKELSPAELGNVIETLSTKLALLWNSRQNMLMMLILLLSAGSLIIGVMNMTGGI